MPVPFQPPRSHVVRSLCAIAVSMLCCCLGAEDDTCDVPSEALSVIATVIDDGRGVRAEVDLDEGDRTLSRPLRLCDEDWLRINGREVKETPKFDRVVYSVRFDPEDAPRQVRFELQRDQDEQTIEFAVEVPAPFEIVQPARNERVSRSRPSVVRWEPAATTASDIHLELNEAIGGGVCLTTPIARHAYKKSGGISVADTGSWTIPADAIVAPEDFRLCEAQLWLTRANVGAYPEALEPSGYVHARVQRRVTFFSVP